MTAAVIGIVTGDDVTPQIAAKSLSAALLLSRNGVSAGGARPNDFFVVGGAVVARPSSMDVTTAPTAQTLGPASALVTYLPIQLFKDNHLNLIADPRLNLLTL